MSKGDHRRKEDAQRVRDNWPFSDKEEEKPKPPPPEKPKQP